MHNLTNILDATVWGATPGQGMQGCVRLRLNSPILGLTQESLSLRMVTARVLDSLSSSVVLLRPKMSQIETGLTLTWFSDSRGIHSLQCWEPDFYITTAGTGERTRATGVAGGCGNHYTTRALSCDWTIRCDVLILSLRRHGSVTRWLPVAVDSVIVKWRNKTHGICIHNCSCCAGYWNITWRRMG